MLRFEQEARAAAALNHPHIAHIYEIGKAEGMSFIAMEFIDGETLRQKIHSDKTNLARLLEWLAQVADGLSKAHSAGIVHRDLKPDNVMISRDGYAKILDFGLAKLLGPQTSDATGVNPEAATEMLTPPLSVPGMILGTLGYMSPEQARGQEQIDARSDIFSFGCMLYEAATRRQPFTANTVVDSLHKIIHAQPPPVNELNASAPIDLQRVVRRCLAKDPDERYQTIRDVATELKEVRQEIEKSKEVELSISPPITSPMSETENQTIDTALKRASATNTTTRSNADYFVGAGKRHFRAVAPIIFALMIIAAFGIIYILNRPKAKTTIDSIAVLPFENVSHDPNTEYLSDGITESLIFSLSQLPHIKVIARNSVFTYKNQTPNLQEVARTLAVHAVLTGRVINKGNTLSVSVELTDTQNNTQLWGQRYTHQDADILSVQDEIARQVTDSLRVRLTGEQEEQVNKRYTSNAEAYRLYLQGSYYFNQYSEASLKRSVQLFDQAIALDERYALAYAARAQSLTNQVDFLPKGEAVRRAKQDISAALKIDNKLAEALATQAQIKAQFDWDFAGAEADFKQAIAMAPNYAEGHHQYSFYLALMERPSESLAEIKLAQQLDPVNPHSSVDAFLPYYLGRQFDQSIVESRKTVEMFPNFALGYWTIGIALFQKGDYASGIEQLEKAAEMDRTPHSISTLGYAYAKSGRKEQALKLLDELKEQLKQGRVPDYLIAMIYVGLGENNEAFNWLEKAYQAHSWWLHFLKADPMVDGIRSDPRFVNLIKRIGM